MLDIIRVLKSAKAHEHDALIPLTTPWDDVLDPACVLPEHPRPTLARPRYTMLNGLWDYAIVPAPGAPSAAHAQDASARTHREEPSALSPDAALAAVTDAPIPSSFDGQILVPFSPEAPLSGVGRNLQPHELLWYRTSFDTPKLARDERLVLHIDAVDWICALRVNGRLAATHRGGYLPFSVDITPRLSPTGEGDCTELALCVYDPSDAGTQPRGKQRLKPGGIWYTAQSGIWQSVWYEIVPTVHLADLTLEGTADGVLRITAQVAGLNSQAGGLTGKEAAADDGASRSAVPRTPHGVELVLTVRSDAGEPVARATIPVPAPDRARATIEVSGRIMVEHPHLWSPDDPYLYDVKAQLIVHPDATEAPSAWSKDDALTPHADTVCSYCAFRTVEVRPDAAGTPRFFLNGAPLLLRGVLDQGYWPDGLMTAPSDEALVHDIRSMKAAGFNMLRKHIKIECARWYYHCDRLGMLVWQDAVSGGSPYSPWHTSRKPTLFQASWDRFRDDTPAHRRALSAGDEEYRREWTDTCAEMVRSLKGHPSIVCWVLFNGGWGQFDARRAVELVRHLDSTRPIDATSGWYDQRCGDFLSHHNYFRPLTVDRDPGAPSAARAFALSEFGGWTQLVPGHSASPRAYGYGDFPTLDAWRAAVWDTLDRAAALESQGLTGFVYTQLSDVEDELNGLLTYDRRVNKLSCDSDATEQSEAPASA